MEETTDENTGQFLICSIQRIEIEKKTKKCNNINDKITHLEYQVIRVGKKAGNDLFLNQSDGMICNGKWHFKTLAKLKKTSTSELKKELKKHPRLKAFGLKKEGLVAMLIDHYTNPSHKVYSK